MFVVEANHKVHEEIETIPLHSLNLLVTIEPLKACSAQCCNLTFPWSQNALEVRMLSKSLPLPKLNTRKRYLCVGDSHVNISVKYTTMPQGRTIAATSAVLSKNLFTFLGFLHPTSSSSPSMSGTSILELSKGGGGGVQNFGYGIAISWVPIWLSRLWWCSQNFEAFWCFSLVMGGCGQHWTMLILLSIATLDFGVVL